MMLQRLEGETQMWIQCICVCVWFQCNDDVVSMCHLCTGNRGSNYGEFIATADFIYPFCCFINLFLLHAKKWLIPGDHFSSAMVSHLSKCHIKMGKNSRKITSNYSHTDLLFVPKNITYNELWWCTICPICEKNVSCSISIRMWAAGRQPSRCFGSPTHGEPWPCPYPLRHHPPTMTYFPTLDTHNKRNSIALTQRPIIHLLQVTRNLLCIFLYWLQNF